MKVDKEWLGRAMADPELEKKYRQMLNERFGGYDKYSDWSIGKLKAYCEARGVKAAKLKRKELMFHVEQLERIELQPVQWDTQGIIEDLERTVEEYRQFYSGRVD